MSSSFASFCQTAQQRPPSVAVVLGSGANVVAERVQAEAEVHFVDVPGLGATSVSGHRGRLTLGDWGGQRVLVFEGRLHYYEGHPWDRVVEPIRLAHSLGARVLLATNAAGGIHPVLVPGGLMALRDHVLWNVPRPWLHPGPGARPSPYSPRLLLTLMEAAHQIGVELMPGVYASLTGPCYETPAEIRALRTWGVDAVGMSTAREVETAAALGMECAAVSCITNKAAGLSEGPLNHQEVLVNAAQQTGRVAQMIEAFLHRLAATSSGAR